MLVVFWLGKCDRSHAKQKLSQRGMRMDAPMAHADILWLSVEREATLGHARLPQDTSISVYGPPGRHEGCGRTVRAIRIAHLGLYTSGGSSHGSFVSRYIMP